MADPATTTQAAPAQPGLVSISNEQIKRALASPMAAPSAASALGEALHLSPEQIAALTGGSGLQLTHEQYANLTKSLSALRKSETKANDNRPGAAPTADTGANDGICGSSSSPAPAPAGPTVASVATTTRADVTETNAGTTQKTDHVGVGTVTLRADVSGQVAGISPTHLFALSYKGTDSKDNHWLQFIHREILGIHADGSVTPQTGNVTTTGGTYKLTTGGTATAGGMPGKDNYNTDTASSDPFYEAGGAANRTADSTTMYDLPSPLAPRIQAAFAAGAARVVSRAHFDTFLITTDHVVYKANTDVVWDYASATATPHPVTTMTGGAATGLPATIAEKFHDQFPAFNFIK